MTSGLSTVPPMRAVPHNLGPLRSKVLQKCAASHHPSKRSHRICSSSPGHGEGARGDLKRREILLGLSGALGCSSLLMSPASKAGLAQFPANDLKNRYLLVRAGESEVEGGNSTLTNPVWKTSLACGLSGTGKQQVLQSTLGALRQLSACDDSCWLWPSITQNSYQTAEILAYQLDVGRSRIVPEYSFLDARGLGALDGVSPGSAWEALQKGDSLDPNWRPPPGTDGTPNESVEDVLTRMRQVLSITETQYNGQDVVLITPDSDPLSVLQAAVLGVDLRYHSRYRFQPGEVRQLQLSAVVRDDSPLTLPCPDPPQCRGGR